MDINGIIGYMKYRYPKLYAQYQDEMTIIDNDRTSGTRFVQSLACQRKWAEHAKGLMEQATTGKMVAS
jgi:hypothetical protein